MTNGNFMLGATIAMTFFSGVAGFFLVLAVFLQTGFGLSPLESGLTTVPFPCGVFVASLVSGQNGQPLAAPAHCRWRPHSGRRHDSPALCGGARRRQRRPLAASCLRC